jgi:hypothetical protein
MQIINDLCYSNIMKTIQTVRFKAPIQILKDQMIARLPEQESEKLPSRGQVAVSGSINGHDVTIVLEPDGYWGHWLYINKDLQHDAGIAVGDIVTFELTPTKVWPEPDVPTDFAKALETAPLKVKDKWQDITSMARWEWIRWVNATGNSDTRVIRIEKSISKLAGTHRRPCCFNLAACTDPNLSKSGRLIQSTA